MTNTKEQADTRVIRGTDATWFENGDVLGDPTPSTVRVLFYSPTIREMREAAEEYEARFAANPDQPVYMTEVLIKRLHSIPAKGVGVGQPNPLTLEWLEAQDLRSLTNVQEAIQAELNPKSTPGS